MHPRSLVLVLGLAACNGLGSWGDNTIKPSNVDDTDTTTSDGVDTDPGETDPPRETNVWETGDDDDTDASSGGPGGGPGGGSTNLCGNGQLDAGEACDGTLLNGQTCQGNFLFGGPLGCLPDCSAVDLSTCLQQGLCTDTCSDAGDGWCDDGGPGRDFSLCALGTDCTDCGPRDPGYAGCEFSCRWDGDGACDDGGPGSSFSVCDFGTDCSDCGPR